jgi:F-type H+-transporting ATPase subunit delta
VTEQALPRKYAQAVFSLALERWLASLKTVQDRLVDDPALAGRLADDGRTFGERQKEMDALMPANTEQIFRKFLYTLLENGDISLLGEVLAELERMSSGGAHVQTARVTTAIVLSDKQKEEFRQKLRQKYDDNLEFVFSINPAIIGGVIVQVGDKVMDGSVSARLQAMGNTLGVKN